MLIIVLSMLVPTLFVGGCLYYFIFTVLADQLALPDMIACDLMPVVRKINVILAVGLPLVFAVILSWAAWLSYKFLRPLESLEEDLQKIDEGDYSVRLQIQDDHDLGPIAGVINDLVEKLDKKKE
jgi:nitrate/nitrite-specific signal transduction histidine kinase